jgi:hypothetical protein
MTIIVVDLLAEYLEKFSTNIRMMVATQAV